MFFFFLPFAVQFLAETVPFCERSRFEFQLNKMHVWRGTHSPTARYQFELSARCVKWDVCAASSGLCECTSSIRFKVDDAWRVYKPDVDVAKTLCKGGYLGPTSEGVYVTQLRHRQPCDVNPPPLRTIFIP
jgi:hypothetical protein